MKKKDGPALTRAFTRALPLAFLVFLIGSTWAKDMQIEIKNHLFIPAKMTVKAGDSVTWTNEDEDPHTVMEKDGKFRSGALDTKDTYSFQFTRPGTYAYFCTMHPMMVGSIKVVGKKTSRRQNEVLSPAK